MHFEITIPNGSHPMVYRCTTATEAFGCMEDLASGYLQTALLNLDGIMEIIVDMARGKMICHQSHYYQIRMVVGEV